MPGQNRDRPQLAGEPSAISSFDLDDPAATKHRPIVLGGPDPAPTEQLAVLEGETEYGEVLEIEVTTG